MTEKQKSTNGSLTVNYDTTSSPWINLGIVGLFRYIDHHGGEIGEIEGDSEKFALEIRGDVEKAITKFVNDSVGMLYTEEADSHSYFYDSEAEEVKPYRERKIKAKNPSRCYWSKLWRRPLLKPESTVEVERLEEKGVEVPDDFDGEEMDTSPKHVSMTPKTDFSKEPRSVSCSFCGSRRKTENVREWEYPLGSSPGRFANFKPNLKVGEKICAPCSLVSVFSISEMVSNVYWEGRITYHVSIIPDSADLKELYGIQNTLKVPPEEVPKPIPWMVTVILPIVIGIVAAMLYIRRRLGSIAKTTKET